jgi:hypothetical protein
MPTADQHTERLDFPAAVYNVQAASGSTTSTTYTATLSGGGTACSCVFIAPKSGKVEIVNTAQLWTTVSGNAWCTVEVRTGTVIGSGTVVLSANDDRGLLATSTNAFRGSVVTVLTGLSPGDAYHARQVFRVSTASSGNQAMFSRRGLKVEPLP